MTNIVTFTGWAQEKNALSSIVPSSVEPFDYLAYEGDEAFWSAQTMKECDLAIGWSFGGLLMVRGIAEGKLSAKKIVLIAAPFSFLQNNTIHSATSPEQWREFTQNFRKHPDETLKRFQSVLLYGDSNYKQLREDSVPHASRTEEEHARLTYWLNELGKERAYKLDLGQIPQALIIHGENDAVVPVEQASYWHNALPKSDVILVPNCGHAPQWHDPSALERVIRDFADA